jgi:phosphate transport system permease protein
VRRRISPGFDSPGRRVHVPATFIETAAVALTLTILLAAPLERAIFGGDFRTFLLGPEGLVYDPRNSMVVGFVMGFAVIPVIYAIAEDSLSAVPEHLRSGSLACGATPWQTAIRIVIPAALSGIFSGIMVGFGRSVGETMIVLMATGNTAVIDWSVFNGFRAMSATIAVELGEAPEGGTLYRVLFLSALLLFAVTFVVNTAAELIRIRIRARRKAL